MLVSKTATICVTATRTLKFALPLMPTPNASRWNIGKVALGPQRREGAGVGHVDFMLFVSISFANANSVSSGIWAILFVMNVSYCTSSCGQGWWWASVCSL